jgi:hypothetical protein
MSPALDRHRGGSDAERLRENPEQLAVGGPVDRARADADAQRAAMETRNACAGGAGLNVDS